MSLATIPTADLIAELRRRETAPQVTLDLVQLGYLIATIHHIPAQSIRIHTRIPAIVHARHQFIAAATAFIPTATQDQIAATINRHRTIIHHALRAHASRLKSSPYYRATWAKLQPAIGGNAIGEARADNATSPKPPTL